MEGNIGDFIFELNEDINKICVYNKDRTGEPEWYISIDSNIDEKKFHYEIMDWYSKRTTV
jgi:hypothetical protein